MVDLRATILSHASREAPRVRGRFVKVSVAPSVGMGPWSTVASPSRRRALICNILDCAAAVDRHSVVEKARRMIERAKQPLASIAMYQVLVNDLQRAPTDALESHAPNR